MYLSRLSSWVHVRATLFFLFSLIIKVSYCKKSYFSQTNNTYWDRSSHCAWLGVRGLLHTLLVSTVHQLVDILTITTTAILTGDIANLIVLMINSWEQILKKFHVSRTKRCWHLALVIPRKHGCSSRVATPAPNLSRRGVRRSTCWFPPPLFSIRADSGRNRPIQPNSDRNESWNGRIDKILTKTTSEIGRYGWLWPKWAASHHSSASCGLVRGKKKRGKKKMRRQKNK